MKALEKKETNSLEESIYEEKLLKETKRKIKEQLGSSVEVKKMTQFLATTLIEEGYSVHQLKDSFLISWSGETEQKEFLITEQDKENLLRLERRNSRFVFFYSLIITSLTFLIYLAIEFFKTFDFNF